MGYNQVSGFRFDPEDDVIIENFLNPKIEGQSLLHLEDINEINVYEYDPSNFPALARAGPFGQMWHFFTQLENRYSRGNQVKRSTPYGNWKSTGKDRDIMNGERKIGTRKTLVFYNADKKKTNWIMHEYTSCSADPNENPSYVVNKLINKEDY